MENMKSISIQYTNHMRYIDRPIFQLLKLMWGYLSKERRRWRWWMV